jgi:hypothetical protein
VTVNILPVGAAFGAYGVSLLAYVPQLPLEWTALALGAGSWLVQRQRPLSIPEGLACGLMIAVLLVGAAVLETVAVPHR